jgi:ABC-2 type transport system ATP-binding protein
MITMYVLENEMLKIEGLVKTYGDVRAVDGLTVNVEPGELYAFIGHNGAGKTTTIKCAAGILTFDGGTIEVAGHDIRKEPVQAKKLMAYIPDDPNIYGYMTGMQYLGFLSDIFEIDDKTRKERIEKYSELLSLKAALMMPVNEYSHGMKQKLAVIGAFIHEPKLIIMDEPFVGLDPVAAFTLKGLMREHCDSGGAIFFSTHVLDVAEKLCDRVAIIKEGRLVRTGSMEEVRGDKSLESVFLELEDKNA